MLKKIACFIGIHKWKYHAFSARQCERPTCHSLQMYWPDTGWKDYPAVTINNKTYIGRLPSERRTR